MTRYFLPVALILSGCSTLDPLKENPFEEEVGSDTAETEDTGTEIDSGDTAIKDTDETDTANACAFPVTVWDTDDTDGEAYPESEYDEVTMGNELIAALASSSPSGAVDPGEIEVLRVNIEAKNAECANLTITGFTVLGIWTDNAETDWTPTMVRAVNLSTGEDLGEAALSIPGSIVYAGFDLDLEVPAGSTYALAFYADVSGASAKMDDQVRFDLYHPSLGVSDGVNSYVLWEAGINGNTLVF